MISHLSMLELLWQVFIELVGSQLFIEQQVIKELLNFLMLQLLKNF
jgi:hypothetical protein